MELEINDRNIRPPVQKNIKQTQKIKKQIKEIPAPNISPSSKQKHQDYIKYLEKINKITQNLNKKLKYSYNKELNQVIVKVVDSRTDKVIKEIPPEELQRLHMRIQEAIGLLIDEEI